VSTNPWELLREMRAWMDKHYCDDYEGRCPCNRFSLQQRVDEALEGFDAKAEWKPCASSRRTQSENWESSQYYLSVQLYRPKNKPPVWRWSAEKDGARFADGEEPTVEEAKAAALKAKEVR
jgi:hypothetical protein